MVNGMKYEFLQFAYNFHKDILSNEDFYTILKKLKKWKEYQQNADSIMKKI